MFFLVLSFFAGVLTVAAPCILPLLPVIIGGSFLESNKDKPEKRWLRPLVIVTSLAISVILFTLLIKASTILLGVPQYVWQIISGSIVILLGANYLFPNFWKKLFGVSKFYEGSNKLLGKAFSKNGLGGSVLIGLALGPVFNSCSPTYLLIVASILPVSFAEGLSYLVAYALGMSLTLLLITYLGQGFISKLKFLNSPYFSKTIGILFVLVGLFVLFGLDKKVQSYVIDQGWYAPVSSLEIKFRD